MAFDLKNTYNKFFAEPGTKINRSINQAIGKEVFQDIKPIEGPKEFRTLDSFDTYTVIEPEQWQLLTGTEKSFSLLGNTVKVSANLDTCMQYVQSFKEAAKYYADRFEFRYNQCVNDYDTLLHYFYEIYEEGLVPMLNRAYSLLLPFNIFSVSIDSFRSYHINTYHKAIDSYNTMFNIVANRNQDAQALGDKVGNSVRLSGGGFGFKGAMKGVAKAEAFNLGMGMIGKYISNQTRMSDQEKNNVFSKFNKEIFFQEVYFDYLNTFFTMIQTLVENGPLSEISTRTGEEYVTITNNLNNPMFPADKVAPLLAQLITKYPFTQSSYNVVKARYGETEEVMEIINYFAV